MSDIPFVVSLSRSNIDFSIVWIQYTATGLNGNWGEWTLVGTCTATCGQNGKHLRTRSCNDPAPSGGGRYCPGEDRQSIGCNLDPCPGKKMYTNLPSARIKGPILPIAYCFQWEFVPRGQTDRQTDRSENITIPKLRWWSVMSNEMIHYRI